ncbi:MAG TPA: hypothetical protein VJ654_11800 [Noviherbaspirillum sp.]|nr:hypothetical protein [Noviherbaspirillum sp.]
MPGSIFLSASVPVRGRGDYWKTADPLLIQSAIRALATTALGRRRIVWGGHPAITPMLMEACNELGLEYGKSVHLYLSLFFKEEFPDENKFFQNVTYVDPVDNDREKSLAKMREQMLSRSDLEAAVFIGGMDGIEVEANLFTRFHPGKQQIYVASTGGATQELAIRTGMSVDEARDINYAKLFYSKLNISPNEPRQSVLP